MLGSLLIQSIMSFASIREVLGRWRTTWRAMLLQRRAQATVAPLPYMGVLLASAGLVQTKTAPRGFEFMLSSFVCCRYEDGHFCCGDMLRDST